MFTSNFKIISVLISILISLNVVLSIEEGFRHSYDNSDCYAIRNEINLEKPDMILIGNSMLGENIDKDTLDNELSRLTHRPIHSKFIVFPGTHMALFYVIFKDQVLSSQAKDIPVGFVTHGAAQFLSTGKGGHEHDDIKDALTEKDPVFFQKYKNRSFKFMYKMKKYSYMCYYSPGASTKIVLGTVGYMYFHEPSLKRVKDILRKRINRLNSDSLNNLDDDSLDLTISRQLPPFFTLTERYSSKSKVKPSVKGSSDDISKSFLPDILASSNRFRIFLLNSRPSPGYINQVSIRAPWSMQKIRHMQSSLELYIEKSGASFIDTIKFHEMNDQSLYIDNLHLTKEGCIENTKLIAKEIFERGLVR